VIGQITTDTGIPIVNRVLDGSTTDIEWNRQALEYMSQITESGFTEGIYVADCKLVIEEHIRTMVRIQSPKNRAKNRHANTTSQNACGVTMWQ
jgi:transposase